MSIMLNRQNKHIETIVNYSPLFIIIMYTTIVIYKNVDRNALNSVKSI